MEEVMYLPMMVWPRRSAVERFMSRTAAAPSEICDALPAWMLPSLAKAGFIFARESAVIPGLMPSSLETVMVVSSSVFGSMYWVVMGAISASNLPACWASRALW